mgnify:CR=1 FL=1
MQGIDLIVCDLDGTLCDVVHRQHLAQAGAWDEFHGLLHMDTPRPVVLSFLKCLQDMDVPPRLTFLTGRPETHAPETMYWLFRQCDLFSGDDYDLLMRGKDEYGSDTVIKQRLMESYLETFYSDSGITKEEWPSRILILDDRDKVVAHFRDLGYQCWQVNEGAF